MTLTDSEIYELYKWLKPQLRRLCRRWPPYYKVLNDCKEIRYIQTKSGAGRVKRVFFPCAHCKGMFTRKEVQIDHILPVVDTALGNSRPDFNTLIERMFCDVTNLQILCKPCHGVKSHAEKKERAEYSRSRKKSKGGKK